MSEGERCVKIKDILICKDEKGGTLVLITACKHPMLRIDTEEVSGFFGPMDMIPADDEPFPAAAIVARWARHPKRTTEEIKAATEFLIPLAEGSYV